jgi:hypothetical protein
MSHHQTMRDVTDSYSSLKYCDEPDDALVIALDYSLPVELPRQSNYVVKEMNLIVSHRTRAGKIF